MALDAVIPVEMGMNEGINNKTSETVQNENV